MNTQARILLVMSHALIREGIKCLLSRDPALVVIAEASDLSEAISQCAKYRPDIVLAELGSDISVFKLPVYARKCDIPAKFVILTSRTDDAYIRESAKKRFAGYFLKTEGSGELVNGLRRIMRGEMVYARAAMERLPAITSKEFHLTSELSAREIDVLRLMGAGWRTNEIARKLSVSVKTVETHRAHLYRKLGMPSDAGPGALVRYAIEHGMVEPDIPSPAAFAPPDRAPAA